MGRVGKKLKLKRFKQALSDIARESPRNNHLFDAIQRTDPSPKINRESYFQFFNRSSRIEFARVRDLIETCISNYPKGEIDEMIARIRSGDDIHFRSAIFELFIHEALLRRGCKLDTHPELNNEKTSKPDFLVTTPEGEEFYLEAVLASVNRDVDEAGESMKNLVVDALSTNPHANFMVEMDDEGYPTTQPSSKKLIAAVHHWLDSFDPDDILEQIESDGFRSVAAFTWKHEGWKVTFRPIPLKTHRRNKSKSLIGSRNMAGGLIDAWSPIRDAVKTKGTKYGQTEKPFLIAVNLDAFYLDRIDEIQALYGQEQLIIEKDNPSKEPKLDRAPNGAWHGKNGPVFSRISGVWIFSDLHPTSIAEARQTLYLNPWSTRKLPESLSYFPHAVLTDGEIKMSNGASFADLFHLNDDWPE